MSNKPTNPNGLSDPERREILRTASGAALGGIAATAFAMTPALAQGVASGDRVNGPLGARLQGVQHFGITAQNMDRAFEFYTEVLGGTEVMRDGDFQGEKILLHVTGRSGDRRAGTQGQSADDRRARPAKAASSVWMFVSCSSTTSSSNCCNIAMRSSRWEAVIAGLSRATT